MRQRVSSDLLRLVIEVVIAAAFVELMAHEVITRWLPDLSELQTGLFEGAALIALVAPLVWWRIGLHTQAIQGAARPSVLALRMAYLFSLMAFAIGMGVTTWVMVLLDKERDTKAHERFASLATRIEANLHARMDIPVFGLRGAVGVHSASVDLSAEEFRQYVKTIDLQRQFPGVRGFGYMVPVQRQRVSAFEAAQRRIIAPDFQVKAAGLQDTLYVVTMVEPLENNQAALGYDEGSDEVRREALMRAISSGEPTLSGRVRLVQDAQRRAGLLYLIPVFKQNAAPTSAEGRARALVGLYYSPIVIEEILNGLQNAGDGHLDIQLTDETAGPAAQALLMTYQQDATRPVARTDLTKVSAIDIGGRHWQLRLRTNRLFNQDLGQEQNAWMGLAGSMLSLALALATWLLVSGRARAEAMAQRMTDDLAKLAQAVKLTSNAVIISDADHRITWVNDGFTRLYGYSFEETIGHRLRDLVFTSNSPAEQQQYLYDCIARGEPCHTELLNRSKDGREFWVDTEVQPQRDAEGRLIGFIKITQNVSELKDAKRRLELALLETEALLNTLHGHAIVSVADPRGRIIEVNDAFCAISGYSREELVGRTHAVVNSRTHNRDFWQEMWRTITRGGIWKGEICNRARDGSLYWVDSIIAPIMGSGQKVERYISIRYDVTSRKVTEQRLRSNQAFLDRVSRTARVGGWQVDLETQVIAWTDQAYRIHDMEPGRQVSFHAVMDMLKEPGRSLLNQARQDAVELGKPWDLEIESVTATGRTIWLRSSGEAEMEGGRPVRLVGAIQDVTERREAQRRLSETMSLLRNVLDSALGISIIATEPTGVITLFNRGAEQLLGYRADEMVGLQTPKHFHAPEEMAVWMKHFVDRTGRQPDPFELLLPAPGDLGKARECLYVHKDGRRIPVALAVSELRDESGVLTGYLGIAQNITQRLEYEASLRAATIEAEQASAAKGQFLANMSHEIRTPMNAIMGMLKLVSRTPLNEAQQDYVHKAQRAAQSLLALVNDVLDFSKIEAQKMELDPHEFEVQPFLDDLCALLQAGIADKPLTLGVQLSPELPPCLIGDAMRLSQVLINLGSNAIKFSPQGRVDIHVDVLNSHGDDYFIRFAVKDTGIGIHPDATQKIFEGFAQAEGSTTRRFGGTGLGLAICQHLVQLMGGDLQLESKLGEGSRFWFDISLKRGTSVLPLQSTVARPGYRVEGSPQAPTARRLEGLRILLVEDNATNRQVARELLVDEGATVSEAVNGLDGVQQVQADPGGFDVVLMDLQMPVMDGLTAAATLRDHLGASTPPIIAMTANVRAADQAEARNAGMVAHVGKPFDLDELVQALLTHGRGMATASGPTPEAETSPAAKASAAIDVDRAVARFGGRKDVYLRMLQSCLGDVRQALAELPRLWAELDTQALRAQLHTLKGLSGTLGHAQLASLMAAAEDEVKGAVWQPETPPCLSKALAALADTPTLIEAVMTELGELPLAQAPADAAPDPVHLHTALRGLLDLLKRSDMSALDAFEALRTRHQAHFAPLLDPLAADMDQLNFAGAILQIQQALDASIQGEAHA